MWIPAVERPDIQTVILLLGTMIPGKPVELSAAETDRLRDAVSELEKALDRDPHLPALYRSMLTRCYFAAAHFHDAGREYRTVLKTGFAQGALRQDVAETMLLSGLPTPTRGRRPPIG